jgi:tetratricopeptide (TPR) repeat protein
MIPEFFENDRPRMFEDELKQDASDDTIDYTRVLSGIFDKVTGAEMEGPLSILKTDEIASETLLQRVEDCLARRVSEYLEFEEPIDECINGDRKIPDRYWTLLEGKLNQKIGGIAPIPVDEQVIKADEILDQGKAEAVEEALFARIREYETAHQKSRDRGLLFFRLARALPVAASIVLCASMLAGYFVYRGSLKTMPSALYQAQGTNFASFDTAIKGVVQSEKGGSLTIVNKKGYVELRNGSKLEIVKASEKEVLYRTRFAGADNQLVGQGSATFFVNHQKKNEKYIVATHDYRIEVTGTYFRLQPDIDGHVSVAVREGEVKIVFTGGETKYLKAGQTLAYDLNSNSFTTMNDGITVPRQEIEQLPDIKDLDDYQRLSIKSAPSAAVWIDGRYIGVAPLVIMQSKGRHDVRLEKNGYRSIDTALQLGIGKPVVLSLALAENAVAQAIAPGTVHVFGDLVIAGKPKPSQKNSSETKPVASPTAYNENDFRDAEYLEAKNWRQALDLYRGFFGDPRTPKLKKEAALFSMAKLEAEHAADKTGAREAFLHYLALYPTGNFVGESWLRLAELEFERDQNKSIEYYQRYFEKYPRHSRISELQYRVGLIYLQKKKYDEAISIFKLSLANYQGSDAIEKEKIQTSLYKAFKEKNESQSTLPASANAKEQ